jgi:anti-sigma B factor antagonist
METYLGEADEQVIVIVADGGLNKGTAGQINDVVQRAIDCGMRGVIVDCARLDILSSAGLASLLMLHRRMKDHGGEVKIAGLQGMSVQVLRLAKLDGIFQLYPDVAQARLSFRPKQG